MPKASSRPADFGSRCAAYLAKPSAYAVRIRPPRRVDVIDAGTKKHIRSIETLGDVREAKCYPSGRRRARFQAVWITLTDNRTMIYSARTGRLVEERADPAKDPQIQDAIDEMRKGFKCPIRYTVVLTISRCCNCFYDFSNGRLESDQVPERAMFKSRKLAEAACRMLARERQARAKNDFFLSGKPRPPQVVALRKTPKGCRFLERVQRGEQSYFPVLRRARPD